MMKKVDVKALSTEELVDRFTEISLQQNEAVNGNDTPRYKRLFKLMTAVVEELQSRSGDQRRALIPLHQHSNIQVRIQAARYTLAIDYNAARRVLEDVAALKIFPQSGDAGMSLVAIDEGYWKPV